MRLGRYLLFFELLWQILFFLVADGAVGRWLAGIWSGSLFGAGLSSGLLLVALALSGRWATAHLISGGSRWAFAGPRGWALAIANLVNYVYQPLFRPVPLFLLAGVLHPERDLLAALIPLLVVELVFAAEDRRAMRSPAGLWGAWFWLPQQVTQRLDKDPMLGAWQVGTWLYDAVLSRRGSADYTLVTNTLRLWLRARGNSFAMLGDHRADPPPEKAGVFLETSRKMLIAAGKAEEQRARAGRAGDGGRHYVAACALLTACDAYGEQLSDKRGRSVTLAAAAAFTAAKADSWALLYGALAAARYDMGQNANRAAAVLRQALAATTGREEKFQHAAVRTAVAVTAMVTHTFGRQEDTIRLLERINRTPPYPAEIRRMTAEHWQIYPVWARQALWDLASFDVMAYQSNRGGKERQQAVDGPFDLALQTLLGSRWGTQSSALPGMNWAGLYGDRFRSPECAVPTPFNRGAALADARGCLDALLAAYGADEPFHGGWIADEVARVFARRREGSRSPEKDPVHQWVTRWRNRETDVFAFIERVRTQELAYLLGQASGRLERSPRPDATMPTKVLATLETAETAYEALLRDSASPPERAAAWQRVTETYQALEMLGASALTAAGRGPAPWLDYPQARDFLRELRGAGHQVLLALFWQVDTRVTILLARHDYDRPVTVTVEMPSDSELRSDLRELGEGRAPGPGAGAGSDSFSWEEAFRPLVAPLVEHSRAGEVLWLVPSGILHHVPLHAVRVRGVPLCDRNPVTVTPSAAVMTRLLVPPRTGGKGSVLLVADSDTQRPLAHARTEVRAAAAALRTADEPLVGSLATKRAVLGVLARDDHDIDIVHFACHGRFHDTKPLDSWIQLAPDPHTPQAGDRLTALELGGLRLDARLVTLSACESGLGDPSLEHERLGLVWAVLQSGARSALVSLWRVDDISTALLMRHFYAALGGGEPRASALSSAQQSLRQTTAAEALRFLTETLRQLPAGHEAARRATQRRMAELLMQARAFDEALELLETVLARTGAEDPDYLRFLAHVTVCRRRKARAAQDAPDLGRRVFDHPYYWAPFQLIGDWR
ncbi:CHAT domain-containing protein [Streptomyces sp. yr375]|uniref:CHAT domain-containing protein n=1 Tax=Streptomyces sp. yr375 TaxID=1761906 RepID=UPI0008ADE399|nr:CHAT domain-containing protein [Streptomyces sp. yr375]SES47956.1 CHAT domain-containing protein [Streptomyces sp. yr375]